VRADPPLRDVFFAAEEDVVFFAVEEDVLFAEEEEAVLLAVPELRADDAVFFGVVPLPDREPFFCAIYATSYFRIKERTMVTTPTPQQ